MGYRSTGRMDLETEEALQCLVAHSWLSRFSSTKAPRGTGEQATWPVVWTMLGGHEIDLPRLVYYAQAYTTTLAI